MARYIDADAFLEKFKSALENAQHYGLYNHAKITQYVMKSIENEPTADVAPKSEMVAEFLKMVENVCKYEESLSYEIIAEGVKRQIAHKNEVNKNAES